MSKERELKQNMIVMHVMREKIFLLVIWGVTQGAWPLAVLEMGRRLHLYIDVDYFTVETPGVDPQ